MTRGTADAVYRNEAAQGTDWARQMDAYPDALVVPWCTWAERASAGDSDADMSPLRYLAKVARARGRDWGLIAENAAGATDVDMDRMFLSPTDGIYAPDNQYRGLMWVSYEDLTNGTQFGGTLANLAEHMQAIPADR